MAEFTIGQVSVQVVPSVRNINKSVAAKLNAQARQIGNEVGRRLGEGIQKGLNDPLSGLTRKAAKDGTEAAGAFSRTFKARIEAALKNLPSAEIKADASDADRKIDSIRRELTTLSGKDLTIRANATEATARVRELQGELRRLSSNAANVDVRVNAGAAQAQLVALQSEINHLDGQTANVNVDDHGGISRMTGGVRGLTLAIVALGPAIAPAIGALAAFGAAGVGAFSAVGAGLAGMVAASVPGIGKVSKALQAQSAASDAAGTAAQSAGKKQSSASNAAATALQHHMAVQQAALQVSRAQQQVERAVSDAARNHAQALQQVKQAEQQLTQAQQSARQAQEALNRARADAKRNLQDLANSVVDASLSVRSAQLGLHQAQVDMADAAQKTAAANQAIVDAQKQLAASQTSAKAVKADPNASAAAKKAADEQVKANKQAVKDAKAAAKEQQWAQKAAKLAVDQAVQSLKEQQLQLKRLRKDKASADKAGIDGDRQVVSARQQLTQANQAVLRQEQQLADSRRNVARVDQQSADQIRAAQDQVKQAHMQAELAATRNGAATSQAFGGMSAAALKYRQAMGSLTGPQRNLLKHFVLLRTAYNAWTKSLERPVLGAWATWLDTARHHLSLLTPVTASTAIALGTLGKQADKALGGPFWSKFSTDLGKAAGPAMLDLGRAAGNLAKGLAGLIDAFLPYAPVFSKWIAKVAKAFADWATDGRGAKAISDLFDYFKENGPLLGQTIKDLAIAIGHVLNSLKPFATINLVALDTLAKLVADMPPWMINALAYAFLGLAVAIKAFNVAMAVADIVSSPVLLIIAAFAVAIGIMAYQIWYVYKNWDQIWKGMRIIALAVWNAAIKPVFDAFAASWNGIVTAAVTAGSALGAAFTWVKNLVITVFNGIVGAFTWAKNLIVSVWNALWTAVWSIVGPPLRLIGSIIASVFNGVIAVFRWFGTLALALWRVVWNTLTFALKLATVAIVRIVQVAWRGVVAVFRWLGNVIKTAWRATWNWIWSWLGPILKKIRGWITTAWHAVVSYFTWLKKGTIAIWKAIWAWIWARLGPVLTNIRNAIRTAWNAVVSAFNWVKKTVSNIWHSLWGGVHKTTSSWMSKIRGVINKAVRDFKSAFEWGKNQIGKVWAGIKSLTAKPVNFVINTVYNKGIAWFFNKVAGFLHIKDRLKALPTIPGYKSGGILPGYSPNRDNMLASSPRGPVALAGGEGIIKAKRVRELGPGFIEAANSGALSNAVKGGLLPGFAGGGIFDTASNVLTKGFKAGGALLGGIGSKLKDGSTWLYDHTVKALWDKFGGKTIGNYINQVAGQSGGWGKTVAEIPKALINKMLAYLEKFNIGSGEGQAADVIRVANKYIGTKESPMGSNRQIFGKRFGMNGVAWCAEFISEVFKEAGAGKAIPRSAAVAAFNGSNLKRRKGAPVPGDLFTYGNSHINLFTGPGKRTVGGNQSNAVTADTSHFGRRSATLIPNYAKSGSAHGGKLAHNKAAYYKFAQDQMRQMGWSVPYNWPSLKALWNRESGWNPYAVNKSSGAYGIPQALGHGHPFKLGDAGAQIAWGLNYIKNRYGNAVKAWRHSQATGWYKGGGIIPQMPGVTDMGLFDSGGWLKPGQLAYNGLSQPEAVLTQKQLEVVATGGGKAPAIGTFNIHVDREADIATYIHDFSYETRRLAKGGVFGG